MTKSDFAQIDQLLQRRLQENNQQLRLELKKDIKAEVDPLHAELDAQRKQITGIGQQITGINKKITGVENRLTGVEQQITGINKKITGVEKELSGVKLQITGVENRLSAQISLEVNDITELIRDIIIPKLEQHDEQITQLQEIAGIKPH